MSETDRYLHGLVDNLENLNGTISITRGYNGSVQPSEEITGNLSSILNISGALSNATLRGMPVELRIDGTILQWKYEDEEEWNDLIDLSTIDYEQLTNLPSINGIQLIGNKTLADLGISSRNEGVASITRNGTTFTVTRPDGTTFTFDQQDTTYDDATTSQSGLMSADDKAKLNGIESGSQENVIESISVNGTEQTITNKNVDISVPTNVSQLNNDSGYQNASQVETAITSKGYQTAEQVGSIVESYGYQNASQVNTAIEAKGYQTANQVNAIVESKGYQTSQQVESAIDAREYQTRSQVTGIVEGYGYQNAQQVENKIESYGYQTNQDVTSTVESYGYQNATQVDDAITAKGYQTQQQVNTLVEGKGYQTASQVTTSIESYGYQDAQDVSTAINDALSGITQIEYHVCASGEYNTTTLVPTLNGEVGVIYLVPKPSSLIGQAVIGKSRISREELSKSGSAIAGQSIVYSQENSSTVNTNTNNIYYEYIYNNSTFELIGDTQMNLDGYLREIDIASMSDVERMLIEIGLMDGYGIVDSAIVDSAIAG